MDQDMPHATKVGIRPSQMELDGDLALPERGKAAPTFLPMSIAAGLDGSGCTEVCLGQATLHYRGLELPPTEKGHSSPHFSALNCLLWPKGRPSQLLLIELLSDRPICN